MTWRRISAQTFVMTKACVAILTPHPRQVFIGHSFIGYNNEWPILFTDDKGKYIMNWKGKRVCEGDEFALACAVADRLNQLSFEVGSDQITIPVDGDLS
jgi:hypothetical protein